MLGVRSQRRDTAGEDVVFVGLLRPYVHPLDLSQDGEMIVDVGGAESFMIGSAPLEIVVGQGLLEIVVW